MSDPIKDNPNTKFSGRTMPTHYCRSCGALWAHVTPDEHPGLPPVLADGYLSARSIEWCQECEAAALDDLNEIPPAVVVGMASSVDRIAELERRVKENDWAGWERDRMAALFREIGLHPNMDLAETLLTRRDARVAAEALEKFGEDFGCAVSSFASQEARRLRREADGGDE